MERVTGSGVGQSRLNLPRPLACLERLRDRLLSACE